MAKIPMQTGEIPVFPDNAEMNFQFDTLFPDRPVVLKFVSHYFWEDGIDHPATLRIFYDIEEAKKVLDELQEAIFQAYARAVKSAVKSGEK